jgi:hypothetical protein
MGGDCARLCPALNRPSAGSDQKKRLAVVQHRDAL